MSERIQVDNRCTGCNICVFVCPKEAIKLQVNSEGFWYPEVNENCVHCGNCVKSCPVYGGKPEGFQQPESYAAWAEDDSIHMRSSSGGIFTLLAQFVLKIEGTVYGAAYDKDFKVKHIRIETPEEIDKLQRSKYVQSYIEPNIYEELSVDLKSGRYVLFSGTPCQVAAVNKYYGKYNNLLTVDVVCHGVPSPKAWDKYLKEVGSDCGIQNINMRFKGSYGWKKYHMIVMLNDGRTVDTRFNDNPWGKSFLQNLFLRESCYRCEFKEFIRCSDISLGDFWEAAKDDHHELDDEDKGTSVVLINSEKGRYAFREIVCFKQTIPYNWIERTSCVVRSSAYNDKRDKAFADLERRGFTNTVNKYCSLGIKSKAKSKIKKLIRKLLPKG